MATVTDFELAHYGKTRPANSAWVTTFPAAEREQMLRDDLTAGRSVSLVLASVVTLGLLGLALIVLAGMPPL
jgi:hypothetical protein